MSFLYKVSEVYRFRNRTGTADEEAITVALAIFKRMWISVLDAS